MMCKSTATSSEYGGAIYLLSIHSEIATTGSECKGSLYVHIVNAQQQKRKDMKFAATVTRYVNKVHATAGTSGNV